MKKLNQNILLLGLVMTGFSIHANAQVQYNGCTVTGTYASAIGRNNKALGNNTFAGGYGSQATGGNSFAFGYNSKATQSTTTAMGNTAIASGVGSMAIGNYVTASAQNAFVFGSGATASYPLTNSVANSIAFGTNSNKPTLLITKSLNNNYTGKVAIGQVASPQTKLHIKSDSNEDAGLFLEPANTDSHKAFIRLFDNSHSITVDRTAAMEFTSGPGALLFKGESYCFGMPDERRARIYTGGTPMMYINATRSGTTENREVRGTSYAVDFDDDAITFRSALHQEPRGSEITNWRKSLLLFTDGKIGIGTPNTYLENNADNTLRIITPNTMDLQSNRITLTGNIGINTVNDTHGYALAVDGGIISTKVFIKEVQQWPDHVFNEDYPLLGLDELRLYLDQNRHLPGIPSESEIVSNGYDLNEMQTCMMEKIEELTRYILLLQEEINALKLQGSPSNDSIVFRYDENGNRVTRCLEFQRIASPLEPGQTTLSVSCELYPNPTPGLFSMLLNEPANLHATLLTVEGTILTEQEIHGNQADFDLSGQAEGVYLLQLDGPEGHQSWRIMKR